MVEVHDDLQRAVRAVPQQELARNSHMRGLVKGISAISTEMLESLEKAGVQRIPDIGEKYDPKLHAAKYEMEDPSVEEGTICQVDSPGYMLGDVVIREAEVGVARPRTSPKFHVTET
jgi:molecular chaperone GrpE